MSGGSGLGWWTRGLDRGEAVLRTRGSILALVTVASLASLVLLPHSGYGPADIDATVTLFLLEVAVLAALLAAGLVSGELRRGITLLWIQKGGAIEVHYLGRLAELLVLTVLLSLVVLGLQGLLLLLLGGDALRFLAIAAPAIPAVVMLVGVPVFALSCSGIQGEGWAALVLMAVWIAAPVLLPEKGMSGLLARGLEVTSPPVGIIAGLREWGLGSGSPSLWEGMGFVAWIAAVGLAGLLFLALRLRKPFPTEPSR
jgi:hypothetical protein